MFTMQWLVVVCNRNELCGLRKLGDPLNAQVGVIKFDLAIKDYFNAFMTRSWVNVILYNTTV